MKAKQSLMAALVGIATIIAMPIAAAAGDQHTEWQGPGAVMRVGHHYGWRNHANDYSGLLCDEDGDDCHAAVQCDEDGDDCHSSTWPGEDYDEFEPSTGYEDRYYAPSGVPAYNSYDSGYDRAYNGPYNNNGAYGSMSNLGPLLQQFFR